MLPVGCYLVFFPIPSQLIGFDRPFLGFRSLIWCVWPPLRRFGDSSVNCTDFATRFEFHWTGEKGRREGTLVPFFLSGIEGVRATGKGGGGGSFVGGRLWVGWWWWPDDDDQRPVDSAHLCSQRWFRRQFTGRARVKGQPFGRSFFFFFLPSTSSYFFSFLFFFFFFCWGSAGLALPCSRSFC